MVIASSSDAGTPDSLIRILALFTTAEKSGTNQRIVTDWPATMGLADPPDSAEVFFSPLTLFRRSLPDQGLVKVSCNTRDQSARKTCDHSCIVIQRWL